jgi:GT2 family glycosyltransferase
MVVVIAAHNEEAALGKALAAVFAQTRAPDAVIVAADNCTDRTVAVARTFPGVTVFETIDNAHKKSGALNQAWQQFGHDADLLVCIDADTELDPCALRDWEAEFAANPALGGCSAKFTMDVRPGMTRWERFLVRLQKNEFSRWTDAALQRDRKTSVLAGTACCLRTDAVLELEGWRDEHESASAGPWSQHSLVEDFELTYRFRQMGWETKVSATVRAYTDSMTDLRSLWAQRMKWTTGTISDLFSFGVNRLTARDWGRQAMGLLTVVFRSLWLVLLAAGVLTHSLSWRPIWLIPPALFAAESIKDALRVPNRTGSDVLVAALILPHEFFMTLRCAWFSASWFEVVWSRLSGRSKDRWALQAAAETGREQTEHHLLTTRSFDVQRIQDNSPRRDGGHRFQVRMDGRDGGHAALPRHGTQGPGQAVERAEPVTICRHRGTRVVGSISYDRRSRRREGPVRGVGVPAPYSGHRRRDRRRCLRLLRSVADPPQALAAQGRA